MNKKIWIAVVAVAMVVVVGGLSFWLPERYVEQGLKALEAELGSVSEISVTRPSSQQFDLHVQLKEAGSPFAANVKNVLKKSIWNSVVKHEVYLDETLLANMPAAQRNLMQKYVADQPLVTAETTFDLMRNYTTNFESVELDNTVEAIQQHLQVAKIVGQVSGNGSGELNMRVDWPGLTITDRAILTVLPITYKSKGQYLVGRVFTGEQELTGEGATLHRKTGMDETSFTLDSYSISSEIHEQDERLQGKTAVSIDNMTLNNGEVPLKVAALHTEIGFAGLEPENIQRLNAAVNEMPATGTPSDAVMTELNQLLRNGFSVELNDWQAKVNELPFSLDADLALTENTVADVNNPMSFIGLLGNFSANLELAFDAGIADIPQLYNAVFRLLMTGALVSADGQYSMTFNMANGLPKLNGEVLSLPGF